MSTARGYSWPPFSRGHTLSQRHGAHSERTVRPIADKFARWLLREAPWCTLPQFRATVAAWATAEAQAVLLRDWVDVHGVVDDDGKPSPALGALERTEGRAARLRGELGLSPSAWAKLVKSLSGADHEAAARGLEQLKATGQALERKLALPGGEPDA